MSNTKPLPKIPMAALKDFYMLRSYFEMAMALYAQDVNNPNRYDRVEEQINKGIATCSKWINDYPAKDF